MMLQSVIKKFDTKMEKPMTRDTTHPREVHSSNGLHSCAGRKAKDPQENERNAHGGIALGLLFGF